MKPPTAFASLLALATVLSTSAATAIAADGPTSSAIDLTGVVIQNKKNVKLSADVGDTLQASTSYEYTITGKATGHGALSFIAPGTDLGAALAKIGFSVNLSGTAVNATGTIPAIVLREKLKGQFAAGSSTATAGATMTVGIRKKDQAYLFLTGVKFKLGSAGPLPPDTGIEITEGQCYITLPAATALSSRPDGLLAPLDRPVFGGNTYGTPSGSMRFNQTFGFGPVKKGKVIKFNYLVQNDGTSTDAIKLTAPAGNEALSLTYKRGRKNVTKEITGEGLLISDLPSRAGVVISVTGRVKEKSATFSGDLVATSSSAVSDTVRFTVGPIINRTALDFDGDGITDWVVVRNTGGGAGGAVSWLISYSSGGTANITLGISTDRFVPGDYDGDGRCDLAVYRSGTVGKFIIRQSSTGSEKTIDLGEGDDDPKVIADYDGDGKTDVAVLRRAASSTDTNHFFYIGSLNNPSRQVTDVPWQTGNGFFPNPGDFDGDGKADFCLQGTASSGGGNAAFYIKRSSDGSEEIVLFGKASDNVVQGDFDGDQRSDFAVARASGGAYQWQILEKDGGGTGLIPITFGASATDFITPGDYDGDGKQDIAVWKSTTGVFSVRRSSDGGTTNFTWGQQGDYPVANYQVN